MKLLLAVATFLVLAMPAFAGDSFWPVTAIDTMKYSRDVSREPDIKERIPAYVKEASTLSPTHISIATPYDEEFYPVLSTWVREARKYKLKVWFRGNFSSWEGWFGYKKFEDYKEHHIKTEAFIKAHPELFEDGDIFTPAPEPENGGLGDPRGSAEKTSKFLAFLVDSYNACERGKSAIRKSFSCGYFSTNGDVARDILTKEVVAKIGGVVVVDHFVKTPERLARDIKALADKYNAKVVLGEFGAPIPDIHGSMSQHDQAAYIASVFQALVGVGDVLIGVNYWTAFGGSTKVFENNLEPRKVADVIRSYYRPSRLIGVVTDQYGNRLGGVKVSLLDGALTKYTDALGRYQLPLPGTLVSLMASSDERYAPVKLEIAGSDHDVEIKNVTLTRTNESIFESLFYRIRGVVTRFQTLFWQN